MDVYEKLARLTETSNRAAVCRLAGLWPDFLYQLLRHRYQIDTPTIVRLAAVLKVDPNWLSGPAGWPPVHLYPSSETAEHSKSGSAA
jgi:hypothetical protein